MLALSWIDRCLSALGRHATKALFVGVLIGLFVPSLAALARPLLTASVLALLVAILVRIDWLAMTKYIRRPALAIVLTLWLLIGTPVMVWAALQPAPAPSALTTAIVLGAAAPPILSAAAIAVFLGLDGPLAIVAGLLSTILVPLTLPPVALGLLGLQLEIGASAFMLRLAGIVGAAFLLAWLARRAMARRRLSERTSTIDGVAVVVMLVFALAIMDGVTETLLARPGVVILWILASFLANAGLQLLGIAAFSWLGRRGALTAGLITGNCNLGLLMAAMPPETPFDVMLYFAVAQFPIFMLPAITAPIYRRLLLPKKGAVG